VAEDHCSTGVHWSVVTYLLTVVPIMPLFSVSVCVPCGAENRFVKSLEKIIYVNMLLTDGSGLQFTVLVIISVRNKSYYCEHMKVAAVAYC